VLAGNLAPLPASGLLSWTKATDLLTHDQTWYVEHPAPQQPGGVSPLLRGTVLHRCFEALTKQGSYDLETIIDGYPELHLLTSQALQDFRSNIVGVLERIATDRTFDWVLDRQLQAYSELPFLMKHGQLLVSGVIDRLVVSGRTGAVVDYKAIDARDDEAVALWSGHYLPQVRVYCEAAKALFKLDSVDGYLFFLDTPRLHLATKV